MNKILYKQLGFNGNDDFGEFEVDYVYLNKLSTEDLPFEKVSEEVDSVKWISKE
jgi:isopentenyldiphosphate isomerase